MLDKSIKEKNVRFLVAANKRLGRALDPRANGAWLSKGACPNYFWKN